MTREGINLAEGGLKVKGETVAVKLMIPENPLTLVRVIVEEALAPAGTVRNVGLAMMVKSGVGGGVIPMM